MLRLDAGIYSISTISRGEYLKWTFWLVEKFGLWRYTIYYYVYWLPGFASPYGSVFQAASILFFLLLISSLLLFLIFEQEWAQIKTGWLKMLLVSKINILAILTSKHGRQLLNEIFIFSKDIGSSLGTQ